MTHDEFSQALKAEIHRHDGMNELELFGKHLSSRPLTKHELRIFLATTGAFFREIPGGILALGLRVTDDWITRDRFHAVSKGATVLYSAVDEFGLSDPRGIGGSHHELFLSMTQHWGFGAEELTDPDCILDEGELLAIATSEFYRRRPIPEALGFHVASELSSNREFVLCEEGFQRFPESYGLRGSDDPVLTFYHVHTLVEPMHGSTSLDGAGIYFEDNPATMAAIMTGAVAFLKPYGRLFRALNRAFYG